MIGVSLLGFLGFSSWAYEPEEGGEDSGICLSHVHGVGSRRWRCGTPSVTSYTTAVAGARLVRFSLVESILEPARSPRPASRRFKYFLHI